MKFKPDQKTGLNCSVAVDQSVNRSRFISPPYLIFKSTQAHLLSFHRQQKSHILPPWHHARPHLYFKKKTAPPGIFVTGTWSHTVAKLLKEAQRTQGIESLT